MARRECRSAQLDSASGEWGGTYQITSPLRDWRRSHVVSPPLAEAIWEALDAGGHGGDLVEESLRHGATERASLVPRLEGWAGMSSMQRRMASMFALRLAVERVVAPAGELVAYGDSPATL